MPKIEKFILLAIGFLIFEIVFIRVGFFLGHQISPYTLLLSFLLYSFGIVVFTIFSGHGTEEKIEDLKTRVLFMLVSLLLSLASLGLSTTYDTSWDGQGYHQTAVIALKNAWNPVQNPSIEFKQRLPSQIFAEGYPSALWEIEASVYALTGRINSGKVVNIAIAIISGSLVFSLLRRLSLGRLMSLFVSLLIVLQPVYILQLLTYMQDGFGYQLVVIASASLIYYIVSRKSSWAAVVFIFSELLLVSTKYSHLPVAFALGFIFAIVVVNRFLNKEVVFNKSVKLFVVLLVFLSAIFAYLPYVRNILFHGSAVYPVNIPELIGAVSYNNIPRNLTESNKVTLLLYGIFSKSQVFESGDPRHPANIAEIKAPFTFTQSELYSAARLFNNRVGAGGPLYSGIVLLALVFVVIVSFTTTKRKQRYAVYFSFFSLGIILGLALLAPTPNLLRYVSQLQLIPFILLIPLYITFQTRLVRAGVVALLTLVAVNSLLYSTAVFSKTVQERALISDQFAQMRSTGNEYRVKAQHFYSSYILLEEQRVPFVATDRLNCEDVGQLLLTSTTSQYCR